MRVSDSKKGRNESDVHVNTKEEEGGHAPSVLKRDSRCCNAKSPRKPPKPREKSSKSLGGKEGQERTICSDERLLMTLGTSNGHSASNTKEIRKRSTQTKKPQTQSKGKEERNRTIC